MNLYKMKKRRREEVDEIFSGIVEPETGEILAPFALDALQIKQDEELLDLACMKLEYDAYAEAMKATENSIRSRRIALEKRSEFIKQYLSDELKGRKIEDERVKIAHRKNTMVHVWNLDVLPDEYCRVVFEPRKNDIARALKNGVKVPGSKLVETSSIQIK